MSDSPPPDDSAPDDSAPDDSAPDATLPADAIPEAELPPEPVSAEPVSAEPDAPAVVAEGVEGVEDAKHGPRRHRKPHRTWPQRMLLTLNCVVVLACFVAASGLLVGRHYGNSLSKVTLETPTTPPPTSGPPATDANGVTVPTIETATSSGGPVETYPTVDPAARNFLITGADNNACVDPASPYAGAFGNRETMGERSDTIMIMRVDPSKKAAAVLSFPRDLWVTIDGGNKKNRINSAYVRDDPQKLINTIFSNFGVGVDHFIQIDFCAFRTIVNGLGGVSVPFEFPARDKNTGLNVPTKGCFAFNGDHALAYVRSRHYQYQNDQGKWKEDPASDLGRVSRQQDFLRRVLSAALDRGITDPNVARSLIKAAQENIVVDSGLTAARMLEFAGVLRDFVPGAIATYQIEAVGDTIGGNSVLVPKIKGDNMQAILKIFRGESPLAGAPEQVFETTTTSGPPSATTTPGGTTSTTAAPTETVPTATVAPPDENVKGIVPPKDVTC
ncbi:MAG: hypothetical protein RLZZ623_3786 [Actinomycetota bacterium]